MITITNMQELKDAQLKPDLEKYIVDIFNYQDKDYKENENKVILLQEDEIYNLPIPEFKGKRLDAIKVIDYVIKIECDNKLYYIVKVFHSENCIKIIVPESSIYNWLEVQL